MTATVTLAAVPIGGLVVVVLAGWQARRLTMPARGLHTRDSPAVPVRDTCVRELDRHGLARLDDRWVALDFDDATYCRPCLTDGATGAGLLASVLAGRPDAERVEVERGDPRWQTDLGRVLCTGHRERKGAGEA